MEEVFPAILPGFTQRTSDKGMNDAHLAADNTTGVGLTPEGYALLQRELEHLTTTKRPEIAERIRESLQHGEFSEDNSELDEVKFEQAMVEGRIAELKTIFGNAHILEESSIPIDHVGLGSRAMVRDPEFDDEFEVRVVASIEADPSRDLISNESPMGTALLGHSEGDTVEFETPDGKKKFKILKITR
jgi:transcription elongation factor GreA